MDVEASAEDLAAEQSNRRATPRLPVDGVASLLVLKRDCRVPCRVTDLSMGGCRIETQMRFLAGILVRVEVSFTVRGLLFRFNGVTQWTDGKRLVGIRFVDMTSRRRDELAEILREVEEENAAKAGEQDAEEQVAVERAEAGAQVQPEPTVEVLPVTPLAMVPQPAPIESCNSCAVGSSESSLDASLPAGSSAPSKAAVEVQESGCQPAVQRTAKPAKRERRTQSRHEVDTSAEIYLVNVGSRLRGRIHDLSLGGCRIRTNDRFPVGIYTRVETEFRLEGLPFRLGGVIQAIHDRQQVGIRFLDLSERKRAQVEQLIGEIVEMRERQKPGVSDGSTEEALGA